MRFKQTHTDFRRGQKIEVFMRDGERFVDKYIEKKSGVIVLEKCGRLSMNKVRATVIYKGGQQ